MKHSRSFYLRLLSACVLCLVAMAIKGVTMTGAMEGMQALFIPDFSALASASLWIDAVGQVFYSMSVMMAIMFAYGSFLDRKSNIAEDCMVIALSDMAVSVLAGIVLFTTMYGSGMTTADMSSSGIGTAFIIYPMTIVTLTDSGVFNAIFAFIFYFCLKIYCHSAKARRMLSPHSPLFSGWNCIPATLSFATAAVISIP